MKLRHIISLTAIVVGGLFVSWGAAHHGIQAVTWDHEANALAVTKTTTRTVHPDSYDTLAINTKLPVVVRPSNVNKLTIKQQSTNQTKHPVTTTLDHKTLTISGGDNRQHSLMIHGLTITTDDEAFDTSAHILVEVPKRTSLKHLVLKKSWSVRLENLTVQDVQGSTGGSFQAKNTTFEKTLDLRKGDADIYLTSVTAPEVLAHTGDGDIQVKQSTFKSDQNQFTTEDGDIYLSTTELGGGRLDSSDGDIHVRNNHLHGTLAARTYEGDLYGLVPDTAGVTVYGTDDSDIQLFGRMRKSGTTIRPNAKVQYSFNTGDDGDITVR